MCTTVSAAEVCLTVATSPPVRAPAPNASMAALLGSVIPWSLRITAEANMAFREGLVSWISVSSGFPQATKHLQE